MKRSELVEIVRDCAVLVGAPEDARDALVAAVSNPSVTRVARGNWAVPSLDCYCPAALAGLVDYERVLESELPPYVVRFASAFDEETRDRHLRQRPRGAVPLTIDIED